MNIRVAELDRLRVRALELVDLDTQAFEGVRASFKLPATNAAEHKLKDQAVQAATRRATEVPAETMGLAVRALELAAEGAPSINKNLVTDCASGALSLWSAVEAAWLNVRVNAPGLEDKAWARAQLARGEELRERAASLRESVLAACTKDLA